MLQAPILDNIDRLPEAPSIDDFFRSFVAANKPVVMQGLYRGQPVASLTDLVGARARLATMPVESGPPYEAHRGTSADARWMTTFGNFLDSGPEPGRVVSEYRSPPDFRKLWRLPSYVERQCPGTEPASCLFAAGGGESTLVHFDNDCCCVLLTQVFGRKRVVVVAPGEAQKLQPYGLKSVSLSGLRLMRFSARAQEEFLRYTNAWETILEPGDTIYIPPLYWHYVEYLNAGLSFNVRFWSNPTMVALARLLLVGPALPGVGPLLVQGIGPWFVTEGTAPPGARANLEDLLHRCADLRTRGEAAGVEIARALWALHHALCPDRFTAPWTLAEDRLWASSLEEEADVVPVTEADQVRLAPGVRLLQSLEQPVRSIAIVLAGVAIELNPEDDEWSTVLPALIELARTVGSPQTVAALPTATSAPRDALLEGLTVLRTLGCIEAIRPDH